MSMKKINILLVEDNPADAILIKKIFETAETECEIDIAEDGEVAMDVLNNSDGVNPDLVLLDINMPKKDGKQVLSEIKSNEILRHIPVIMLTSSNAASDIMDCYKLCASSYVIKPASIDDHKKLLSAFNAFWFDCAQLPKNLN